MRVYPQKMHGMAPCFCTSCRSKERPMTRQEVRAAADWLDARQDGLGLDEDQLSLNLDNLNP